MSVRVEINKTVYQQILHVDEHPLHPILKEVFPLKNVGVEMQADMAVIDNITDYNTFSTRALMGIISVKGEVFNYPVFIEVPESKYQDDVPAFMPNRTLVVNELEGAKETARKWSEYKGANTEHAEIKGSYFIENDGHGDFLLGSQIAGLVQSGYKVYSQPEYVALQASLATDEEI